MGQSHAGNRPVGAPENDHSASQPRAFLRQALAEAGVSADNLRSLEDIRRIPFTSKDDLRSQYPYGLATVPHSEFVRMHCSSGTTGTPVAVCYTQPDINSWADLMARCLYMAGVRKDDVFQNMSGYGLFTGASASISAPSASAA